MKKFLFFAALAATVLSSCNKNENNTGNDFPKVVKTITATISPDTKVVMGQDNGIVTKLNWQKDDALMVIADDIYKYVSAEDGESVVFDLQEGNGLFSENSAIGLYPYDRMSYVMNPYAPIVFEFAAEQAYVANSFDRNALPMVAWNMSGIDLIFHAAAPVLRINVKLDNETASDVKVNKLTVESSMENLTGISSITITADGEDTSFSFPSPAGGTLGRKITLDCGNGVPINKVEATPFCVVVPDYTYTDGDLTITVETNKGDIIKSNGVVMTLEAGHVYNINITDDPAAPQPLDSDGDGVPDMSDMCPGTPAAAYGQVDGNGCPLDFDGDGVPDFQDNCPFVPGVKVMQGCPED